MKKFCYSCKEEYDISYFYTKGTYCKNCTLDRGRAYRKSKSNNVSSNQHKKKASKAKINYIREVFRNWCLTGEFIR